MPTRRLARRLDRDEAIADQLDAGDVTPIISICPDGWFAVAAGLPAWLYSTSLIDREPLTAAEMD